MRSPVSFNRLTYNEGTGQVTMRLKREQVMVFNDAGGAGVLSVEQFDAGTGGPLTNVNTFNGVWSWKSTALATTSHP
jgi:hypothetical protein